jgi:Xaa-Pro aminopeptidase
VRRNPIDAVWADKPEPSKAKMIVHPDRICRANPRPPSARRWRLAEGSRKATRRCSPALDSIAWTFNVRGQDVEHTPVALSFGIVNDDGTAELFVDSEKLGDEVRQHLGNGVRVHERSEFEEFLGSLSGRTVIADPERAVAAIFEALETAGAKVVQKRDPSVLPRATKNEAEIAGHKAAQERDGAALTRFLHWLSVEAPKGGSMNSAPPPSSSNSARNAATFATPASIRFRAQAPTAPSSTTA